jgi:hypothetical protein
MTKNSVVAVATLATLALALSGCGMEGPTVKEDRAAAQSDTAADTSKGKADTPTSAAHTELDTLMVGRFRPPDPEGFVEEGGTIERAGADEVFIVFGRWTQGGEAQRVMLVERAVGPEVADAQGRRRMRAQIVQAYLLPPLREGEFLVTEGCTSSDFGDDVIFANASTAGRRPGQTDPPSAAWRFDRQTGRLVATDASRVTCAFDHME